MTMTMAPWKDKRAEWTKARDAAHVKKGVVSSVSLGDGLDKLYKSSAKGYRPLLGAIAALEKDLKTYQTKGGKAVAPVDKWLSALDTDLDKLAAAAKSDANKLNLLDPYLTKFHRLCVPGVPDAGATKLVIDLLAVDKEKGGTKTWLEGAKETKLYNQLPDLAKEWAKVVKTFQTWSFGLTLPGMDAQYAAMSSLGKRYELGLKYVLAFGKVKDADDHFALMKPAHSAMNDVEMASQNFERGIAKLLG